MWHDQKRNTKLLWSRWDLVRKVRKQSYKIFTLHLDRRHWCLHERMWAHPHVSPHVAQILAIWKWHVYVLNARALLCFAWHTARKTTKRSKKKTKAVGKKLTAVATKAPQKITKVATTPVPENTLTGKCPQCGITISGKISCCLRGGAWVGKCGNPGDNNFEHTFAEGIAVCKGRTCIRVLLPMWCWSHFISPNVILFFVLRINNQKKS